MLFYLYFSVQLQLNSSSFSTSRELVERRVRLHGNHITIIKRVVEAQRHGPKERREKHRDDTQNETSIEGCEIIRK